MNAGAWILGVIPGLSIKGENVAEILKNVTFEQQASAKWIID